VEQPDLVDRLRLNNEIRVQEKRKKENKKETSFMGRSP
jgi:hypothetical protein